MHYLSEFNVYVNIAKIRKEGRVICDEVSSVCKSKDIYFFFFKKGVMVKSGGMTFSSLSDSLGYKVSRDFGTAIKFKADPDIWQYPVIKKVDLARLQLAKYMLDLNISHLTPAKKAKAEINIYVNDDLIEPISIDTIFKGKPC